MNIRQHHGLLLGTAMYLGMTATAFAAQCPEGGEEAACAQARAIVDRFLSNITPPTQDLGRLDLGQTPYDMTLDGDLYQVSFPQAAWIVEEVRIDFGPLNFQIDPQDNGASKVEFRVGDTLSIQENQKVVAKISIAKQNNQGLWDAKLENFANADWKMSNIQLEVPEEPVAMSLADIHVTQVMNRADDDTWKQEGTMQLANFKFQAEGNTLSLGQIAGDFDIAGRNYQKILTLGDELKALMKKDLEGPEAGKQFMDFFSGIYALFSHFESNIVASDLLVGTPEQPMGKLARLSITSGYDEGDSSGAGINYQIEMSGLETQAPGVPPNLLPNSARLGLEVVNIPSQMFNTLMEAAAAAESMSPAEREAHMNQQVMGLLMTSDLRLNIKDAFIAATDARLDLNLRAGVDPQSAMGGTGELMLRIEGMQNVIDAAGAMAQEQGPAQAIGMLMMFSNRTEENGKIVDSYDLKFTKEGQLWLNGKDMTPMLMGGGAPPPSAPSTAE